MSTPGLLAHAVRTYGWGFIPNHVLLPMVANIGLIALRIQIDTLTNEP